MSDSYARKKGVLIWILIVLFISMVLSNVCALYGAYRIGVFTDILEYISTSGTQGAVSSAPTVWDIVKVLLVIGLILFVFSIAFGLLCAIVGKIINPIIKLLDSITLARQIVVVVVFLFTVIISVLFSYNIIEVELGTIGKIHIACFICLVTEGALWQMGGDFMDDFRYVSGSHYEVSFDGDGVGTAREVTDYSTTDGYIDNTARFLFWVLAIILAGTLVFLVKAVKLVKKY